MFVNLAESHTIVWDGDPITPDIEWTGRKTHEAPGTWTAVKLVDEHPITAMLATIRAVWLASGPKPHQGEGALMGLIDGIKGLIDPFRVESRSAAPFTVSYEYPNLQTQISTMTGWRRAHGYGPPSVREALGVPSILSCVSLIQGTVGQLTAEGWRNGVRMDESPRIISRPDPWNTPRDFYAPSGFNMATYGEVGVVHRQLRR